MAFARSSCIYCGFVIIIIKTRYQHKSWRKESDPTHTQKPIGSLLVPIRPIPGGSWYFCFLACQPVPCQQQNENARHFGFCLVLFIVFFLARRLAIFIRLSRFQLQISFSFSCFHRLLKILISFFFSLLWHFSLRNPRRWWSCFARTLAKCVTRMALSSASSANSPSKNS